MEQKVSSRVAIAVNDRSMDTTAMAKQAKVIRLFQVA